MANVISDETIEYVGILAKLELSGEEKEQAILTNWRNWILPRRSLCHIYLGCKMYSGMT